MADDKKDTINNKGIKSVNLQLELKGDEEDKNKKKKEEAKKLKTEIVCIITIVLGSLIFLSLSNENGGLFGNSLNFVLKSLFGYGAFILPFLVILVGVLFFIKKEEIKKIKILYFTLVFLSLVTLIYIMSVTIVTDEKIEGTSIVSEQKKDNTEKQGEKVIDEEKFKIDMAVASKDNKSGGFIGKIIGSILVKVLGKVGSYILIWTLILILGILITGKSFFGVILFIIMFILGNIKNAIYKLFKGGNFDENDIKDKDNKEVKEEVKMLEIKSKKKKKNKFDFKNKIKGFLYNMYDEELYEDEEGEYEEDEEYLISEDEYIEDIKEEQKEDIEHKTDKYDYSNVILLPGQEEIEFPVNKENQVEKLNINKKSDNQQKETKTPNTKNKNNVYNFPPITLLTKNMTINTKNSNQQKIETSRRLEQILKSYGVEAQVKGVSNGPSVTRYEVAPGPGVKVSKISSLADDLALNLAATGIRIEAPIPGKAVVGIEIPNKEVRVVSLREVIEDEAFESFESKLAFGIGIDISGKAIVADIGKMPHLLIAGATGSGKSVCINTLITSIIYKANPDEVKLLMVDPKVVELSIYNGIPHLLIPVVTDPKKAAGALNWAVQEMLSRYALFADANVRDLKGYNNYKKENDMTDFVPQIIIIIDELADLMMAAPNEVEDSICRLAQMARAAGIHLIIATQRPSVDVITGVIKANIPSRLAFSVSSGIDSRTILDMVGAEKLLGKGDMLFYPVGYSKPVRIQGAFVSDKEVENIVDYVKQTKQVDYDKEMIEKITATPKITDSSSSSNDVGDEFMQPSIEFIIKKEKASASMLQRQFRIGYNRASRIIEELEEKGIIGPEDGSKPRKVLMTFNQWQEYKNDKGDN